MGIDGNTGPLLASIFCLDSLELPERESIFREHLSAPALRGSCFRIRWYYWADSRREGLGKCRGTASGANDPAAVLDGSHCNYLYGAFCRI